MAWMTALPAALGDAASWLQRGWLLDVAHAVVVASFFDATASRAHTAGQRAAAVVLCALGGSLTYGLILGQVAPWLMDWRTPALYAGVSVAVQRFPLFRALVAWRPLWAALLLLDDLCNALAAWWARVRVRVCAPVRACARMRECVFACVRSYV